MLELDQLYAAIDDEAAFDAMPATLAKLCGGRSATVTRMDAKGALSYSRMSYFQAEDWEPYYRDGWVQRDPWAALATMSLGRSMVADDFLPPEKFRATAMYNELFRTIGDDTARCTGIVSPTAEDTIIFGIHRPGGDAAFTKENAAKVDTAMVHLRRIFGVRDLIARTMDQFELATTMLESSGKAMLVVDSMLRVRRMTQSAAALFDRRDGVRISFGRIVLEDATAHQRLLGAVKGVVNRLASPDGALLCPRRSTQLSYRLSVLPAGTGAPGCAILIFDDPTAHKSGDRIRRFKAAYGLTPAEAAVAKGLAEDQTLDEIAAARGVAKETIRSQVKSVFLKTGVRRQIDLVKIIIQMP